MVIERDFYPHIRDLILDFAPTEAIPALRLTQRAVRDYLDKRLQRHAVYSFEHDCVYTKKCGFWMPHGVRNEHVRALDFIYDGDASKLWDPKNPIRHLYPNLRFLRDFVSNDFAVEDLCAAREKSAMTLIRFLPSDGFGVWTRAGKLVVVCPHRQSVEAIRRSWQDKVVEAREVVYVFLPEMDPLPDGPPDSQSRLHTSGYARDEYLHQGRSLPGLLGILEDAPSSLKLTFVAGSLNPLLVQALPYGAPDIGQGTSWCEAVKTGMMERLEFSPSDGEREEIEKNLRVLTLDEWRQEITEEEWELVHP